MTDLGNVPGEQRRRWLREPMLHFMVIGAVLFLLYGLAGRDADDEPRQIVVSEGRIQALAEGFARTWSRPPSETELRDLIEDYVAEEVYYREARALGLDRDDLVIRRRLRLKMEFLFDDMGLLEPTDAQLEAHFQQHLQRFATPVRSSFMQVYFNVEDRADARREAEVLFEQLQGGDDGVDPMQAGDPSLLPTAMESAFPEDIAAVFGPDFATEVERAAVGAWVGPLSSPYGLHLVRVEQREAGVVPSLEGVRPLVLMDWQAEQKQQVGDEVLARLLAGYEVRIDAPFDELLLRP